MDVRLPHPGRVASLSAVAAMLLASSCSSSEDGVTAEQACASAQAALCDKLNECAPILIRVGYPDLDTCKARGLTECRNVLLAPSSGRTPAALSTCAADARSLACTELVAARTPESCLPVSGGVATGGACGDDNQCASKFCSASDTRHCGTCAVPPGEGVACVNERCPSPLTCARNVCVRPVAAGAACDDARPCSAELTCSQGTCRAPAGAGERCDNDGRGAPRCNGAQGLVCAASKTCEPIAVAAAGESCGLVSGGLTLCAGDTYCKPEPPVFLSGVCASKAVEGDGCSDEARKGPPCQAPLKCADGVCRYRDPSSCR